MKNTPPTLPFWVAFASVVASLQACTHKPVSSTKPAEPSTPAFEVRLLVKAGQKTQGLAADALAVRAAQISKQNVRYIAASGGGWHSLEMGCDGRSQCDQGLQLLRSQPDEFASVEPEARASFGPGLPLSAPSR